MLPLDSPIEDVFLQKRNARVYIWVIAAVIPFVWGGYYWYHSFGKGYVDFFMFRLNYKQFCFFQVGVLMLLSVWCYQIEKHGRIHRLLPIMLFSFSVMLVSTFYLSYRSIERLILSISDGIDTNQLSDYLISIFMALLFSAEVVFASNLLFRKSLKNEAPHK